MRLKCLFQDELSIINPELLVADKFFIAKLISIIIVGFIKNKLGFCVRLAFN
jgi:hypothetical protein